MSQQINTNVSECDDSIHYTAPSDQIDTRKTMQRRPKISTRCQILAGVPLCLDNPPGFFAQYRFIEKEHKIQLNHGQTTFSSSTSNSGDHVYYINQVSLKSKQIKVFKSAEKWPTDQNKLSSSPVNLNHNISRRNQKSLESEQAHGENGRKIEAILKMATLKKSEYHVYLMSGFYLHFSSIVQKNSKKKHFDPLCTIFRNNDHVFRQIKNPNGHFEQDILNNHTNFLRRYLKAKTAKTAKK